MTWLVTITGMGGLGKTTLAVHAANQLKDEFESLWFVDLARVTTARELLQTVALVIGLALEDNVDDESRLTRRITQRLRGRGPCLLLLDNLEQLVSPVETFLARWREELPNVSILATSRTRLGLPAERVFEIAALPVPLESQEADAEIDASPSVELFVRTARKSDAGFSVARDNRVAVAQICASLDGIPLAIELAASRISVLAPAQILDRLKRQTDVLSTSSGAVPARHRTLREAVQWSLNLLNADEKHAIVALSSLPGGCFPELGETVVSRIGTHRSPLDLLQQLRGHSLLRSQATPYGNRLTFYEIVRKTVRDSGGGPADVTRAGLENIVADALIENVESWQRRLVGPESKEAMDRLMLERENLLAIQDAAVTSRNWTLAARTLLVISDALRERGLLHTLTNRLEIPLASLSTEVRVRFQSVRAAYFLATGNWPAALREAQQAVSDAATLAGDSEQNPRGRSLYQLLTVLISSADYAEAQQLLPQAIDDSTQAVDLPTIVRLLMLQGHLADRAGDGVKASESYRRAQEIAVPLGDRGLMAELDRRQGNLATRQGRLSEAAEYFQRSAAIADELGYARHRHLAFTSLGVVHCEQECFEDAIKAFDAAQNLAERLGERRAIAVNEGNRGIALAGLGDHIAAIQSYLRAELINQELGNPLAVALNRGNRALSLAALDDVESSRCLLDEAAQTAAEHGDATNAVLLEGDRGLLLLRNRQFEPALRRLETSCEQLKGLSLHETKSAIPVLLGIAKCHFELGDLQQATYVLESVTKLTNRLGLKRGCRHAILGDCEVVARQLTEALKLG
jgi:tetratricopeptide (TPR) repeat protein